MLRARHLLPSKSCRGSGNSIRGNMLAIVLTVPGVARTVSSACPSPDADRRCPALLKLDEACPQLTMCPTDASENGLAYSTRQGNFCGPGWCVPALLCSPIHAGP